MLVRCRIALPPGLQRLSGVIVVPLQHEPQRPGCGQIAHQLVNRGEKRDDLVVLTMHQRTGEPVARLPEPTILDIALGTFHHGHHRLRFAPGWAGLPLNIEF